MNKNLEFLHIKCLISLLKGTDSIVANSNGLSVIGLLPIKARILCFRFIIIEYSSLMDFGPYRIGLFLHEDFGKMILWLVLKLEISYRVITS